MGAGVRPEVQDDEDPLTAYRQQRDTADPLTAYRRSRGIVLPPGDGEPDIAASPKLKRLRPVVVSKPEELPKPMQAAEPDVTKVGSTPDGLAGQLQTHAPGQSGHFGTDLAESAMEMVTHPVATAKALAETPARAGYALGKYTRGEGSGKEAAVGAAQTAAMLIGGPAEKLAEPVVARLVGEAAAPVVTRTALGAATGAVFTPDRPAIGATLGGAAGALSSKGVAAAQRAERYARFDELAKQHPDWFGESTGAEKETRANHLLANPNAATARVIDQPPTAPAEPDFTVDEPNKVPSPIEVKGVFGGALEQHGRDYAAGKVPPVGGGTPDWLRERMEREGLDPNRPFNDIDIHNPSVVEAIQNDPSLSPEEKDRILKTGSPKPAFMSTKPAENVNLNVNFAPLASELPSTVEATDAAIEQNAARYNAATDPTERRDILKLHDLLEEHRAALAPPQKEEAKPEKKEGYDYSSTQMNLPKEAALGIKRLANQIPEEDLAENGRETTPHITVKYGLHGKPLDKVRELLKDEGPVTVKLGKTSIFPAGESGNGDVVKVDIDSPQLHRLNKKIADALPHTDTHPEYKPHATVAYVKPGLGKKYEGNDSLAGEEWVLDRLTFSGKDGKTVEIPLKGPSKRLGQNKPKEPVHDDARVASGRLRDNLETVKSDALVHEMFRLLGAEDQTDQQRAIYRTVDDPNMSRPVTVPTIKGGRNLQAEALHRIELKKGVAGRIEKILNARGMDDQAITRRYAELSEIAAERSAELEGMDNEESGDTSFDFGKDEYTSEHGEGAGGGEVAAQRADAGAESAASRSAADAGSWEREGTSPAKGEASNDVAPKRAELYHELHNAGTPEARADVMDRIKALDDKDALFALSRAEPADDEGASDEIRAAERRMRDALHNTSNGYDQSVHDLWKEQGTHGRLALLDRWRRLFPEQEFFPEWADRDAEDLPRHVRDKIGMERVNQVVALRSLMTGNNDDLMALSKVANPEPPEKQREAKALIVALENGIGIGPGTQIYDTTGESSLDTLNKIAQKPHTRQLSEQVRKVFEDIVGAIAKRYNLPPVEFGGLDVRRGSMGINIQRTGLAARSASLGMPIYQGPTHNLILLNPYTMQLEVGLNPRLRPAEYAAALSEMTYATIVHELAHQSARAHDEKFSGYHTRFAGAASAVAQRALAELDSAWQVAIANGIHDDVLTLQREVWNAVEQREYDEGGIAIGSESAERGKGGISLGGDAATAHLRSSEADGGIGEGDAERRRLGARARGSVRGSEAGSEVPRSHSSSTSGAQPRNGRQAEPAVDGRESDPAAVDIDSLKLPEPSGLTQLRSQIRPSELVRALKAFFNPESLGPEARGAAGTIKHQAAEAYRRVSVSTHALKSFQKRIDKLSRKEQVKLWHDAETGQPIGDAELDAGNRLLRQVTEQRTKQLIALDRLKAEKTIENYIGRFWSQTTAKSGRDFLRAIMGRRPFEGPKSFLKGRDLSWFVDGLKRADLVPATYNYVESQLAKIAEMERVIAADHMLRQEQELGRAKPIMLGQELPFDMHGDPWVKIDRTGEDPAFNIYLPPDVPHWEAVDTMVYGKLRKLIDALNVEHLRSPKIGGSRLGYAEGDKFIATKFGGAEGVVMHELGHILDARYGLGDRIDEAIGKAPRRTAKRGKKAGQQVPDYKSEGKEAAKRRQTLREELRQLANLRRETLEGVPSTKDLHPTDRAYLHSSPEKMANMVESYVSARDRFRSVAPGIFEIFDKIVGDHPELHALRDIQPSLAREEHGSTTRVSGIITGGHWYAPRDAAAVWQNHLSKGLAGNPIYDAAIAPVHAGTQMLLGFSGFHGTVIATEGAFSDLALATDNLVNRGGSALKAPGQIARAGISPIAGVTFGRKVMQEYRIPGTHPELKTVLDGMISGGFRGKATSELWSGDRKDRLKRAFRETLHAESKGRRLWGASRLPFNAIWAGVEMASGPLMSKYVPLMKTAATYNAVAQALEKLPANTSIDDMHRVMGDVVKEMDYRFGQVDYDNHFINRVAKDLAQLVFLAPGWTFGTLALAGRGLSDVAKIPKRAAKLAFAGKSGSEGEEPPPELIGRSAAYWIGAVLGTMLINGALTYFNTGERPNGKDYWAFRDGTKDDAGNWNRHTVPGYLMHDIYGWAKHPVHTFKNKFAPTLAFFMRLADNKDYFGDMVYDPDATLPTKLKQSGKALMKEHAPLSVQNYLEGKKRGEVGTSEIARNVFGVTPARRELVRTPAQNKMAEYLARHAAATRTPEEAEKGELHRTVTEAVLKGELLPESVDKALESGSLRRETLMQWIHDARQPSLVLQFKRLSLKEAKRVYELADEDEKSLWANAYRIKVVNGQR